MTPKIAVYDIETSPHLGYFWGLFKQNISPNMIVEDGKILSVGYKWLGDSSLHYYDCKDNPYDDSQVVQRLWELFDSADILIGQNIKHFDTRKANARMIELGLPPPSPYKQVDTKVEAQKIAMFSSNRLEWLAKHLSDEAKDEHPEFPGFKLWQQCLLGNPRAWQVMKEYNLQDVVSTENVYLKLRPWIEGHPNLAVFDDCETPRCPKCGSADLQRRGFSHTQVGKYPRFHCQSCGGWSRGRYTENTLEKRQGLLSS